MITLLKYIKRTLFRPYEALREYIRWRLTPHYVLSFPKSGRTWVRVLLGKYFSLSYGIPVTLEFGRVIKPHRSVPRIAFTHDGYQAHTTEDIRASARRLREKKVILLVRDPRDVVVSYYFQISKRMEGRKDEVRDISLSDFIRLPEFGIGRAVNCINIWLEELAGNDNFLPVRYEDLHEHPEQTLETLLSFLGTPIRKKALIEAVRFGQFEKMHEMEKKGTLGSERLAPGDAGDPESFKTRKGRIGGYKDYVSNEDAAFLNQWMRKLDSRAGYSL